MIETTEQYQARIRALEEMVRGLSTRLDDLDATVEAVNEQNQTTSTTDVGHQNFIRNGDFDLDRNRYLYTTNYSSGGSRVDADVSKEAAFWYVAERDTSQTTTGSITATDNTLTIDGALFISGDAGVEIVVEGAGTGGIDLVTTIASFTSSTVVELTAPAVVTVTNARVRFRLQQLKEDSTDADFEAGEVDPPLT